MAVPTDHCAQEQIKQRGNFTERNSAATKGFRGLEVVCPACRRAMGYGINRNQAGELRQIRNNTDIPSRKLQGPS